MQLVRNHEPCEQCDLPANLFESRNKVKESETQIRTKIDQIFNGFKTIDKMFIHHALASMNFKRQWTINDKTSPNDIVKYYFRETIASDAKSLSLKIWHISLATVASYAICEHILDTEF